MDTIIWSWNLLVFTLYVPSSIFLEMLTSHHTVSGESFSILAKTRDGFWPRVERLLSTSARISANFFTASDYFVFIIYQTMHTFFCYLQKNATSKN